jgi:hypothetical protein
MGLRPLKVMKIIARPSRHRQGAIQNLFNPAEQRLFRQRSRARRWSKRTRSRRNLAKRGT